MNRIGWWSSAIVAAVLVTVGGANADEAVGIAVELAENASATLVRAGVDRTSEIELGPGGERVTLLVRSTDGAELLRVGWNGGFAYGKLLAADAAPAAVENETFDCRAWFEDGWQLRLGSVATAAGARLSGRTRDAAPSPDEVEAVSSAMLIRDVIRAACTVGPDRSRARRAERSRLRTPVETPDDVSIPNAGACYYDNRDSFNSCKGCCEHNVGLLEMTCGLAARYVCTHVGGWWCGPVGGGGCSMAVDLTISECVAHNCVGLPGDPTCPTPKPPCPGLCRNFCGIGWSAACGSCPGPGDQPYQRDCCS